MSEPSKRVQRFFAWFRTNGGRLRHGESGAVADEIGDQLLRVDKRLGVEVGADEPGGRELILTAFSDPNLFRVVHEIAQGLGVVNGWRVVPLKPPRGFAFTLSLGPNRVSAAAFEFQPMRDEIGVRLVPPSEAADALPKGEQRVELGWLLIETGIGEELAGLLQHVEIEEAQKSDPAPHPISELADYVRRTWIH